MNDFSFGRKIKFDTSGNPIINANILPSTTLVYDLGSPNKRWRDIYLSGNTIDLGGTKIQKEIGGGIKIADASGNTLDGKFNNIDISGNATINGIINQAVQLDVSGSILPTRNLVYDLGSPDKRWNDLYLSGNTIDLSGTLLSRHTDGSLMVHDSNSNMVNLRANNIIADGNLTVSGTTTTINSTTVTVQDPIITLGSDITNTKDKGIEFKYGTSKIGFFGYDDSTGNLTFLKDASNNSEVFSGIQGTIEGLAFKSTVASGTAPLTVASSTLVTNLNADLLEGLNPSQFMRTDISTSSTGTITSSSTITGTRLISNIANGTAPLTVASSTLVINLNADLLDGLDSSKFMRTDTNTSTSGNMLVSGNVGVGKNIAGSALDISGTTLISGNLGIGITNPIAKLHVNGDILATNGIMSSYTYTITGTYVANNWYTVFNYYTIPTGVYILKAYISTAGTGGELYEETHSGIFSWFAGNTNSTMADTISTHRAGHAPNTEIVSFRTLRNGYTSGLGLQFQFSSNKNWTNIGSSGLFTINIIRLA